MNTMHHGIQVWRKNLPNVAGSVRDVCVRKIAGSATPAGKRSGKTSQRAILFIEHT